MTFVVMAVKLSFGGVPCRAIAALEGASVILAMMAEKCEKCMTHDDWNGGEDSVLIVTGRQKVLPALRPCALNAGLRTWGIDC